MRRRRTAHLLFFTADEHAVCHVVKTYGMPCDSQMESDTAQLQTAQ